MEAKLSYESGGAEKQKIFDLENYFLFVLSRKMIQVFLQLEV